MVESELREKVRLYVHRFKQKAWTFDEAPHEPINELTIEPLRVYGNYSLFGLPPAQSIHRYLLDTGAMLTLIPKEIWSPNQDRIRWLHTDDGTLKSTKVGGRTHKFRLGLVEMNFIDFDQRTLVRQVIAGFVLRINSLKETILGLGFGNAVSVGGVCLNFVDDVLWLVTL